VSQVTVEVGDLLTGSDLLWRLNERAEVVEEEDGSATVRIQVKDRLTLVLGVIRDWATGEGIDRVIVHIDEKRYVLESGPFLSRR
jgi:hypothetical protein